VNVYRLLRRRYVEGNPFSGEGSYRFGGRWSSAGVRVSYASTHRSLAVLEYRAHIDTALLPDDLVLATLSIPEGVESAAPPALPANWRETPAPEALRRVGDEFVRGGRTAAMYVPSVLVPAEMNVLINVGHKDWNRMRVVEDLEDFWYDRRLI
jgi:RES domain-containing protein